MRVTATSTDAAVHREVNQNVDKLDERQISQNQSGGTQMPFLGLHAIAWASLIALVGFFA